MADFPVTELGETDHVKEGEEAPVFTRPLVNEEYWEDVTLTALLADDPVVLLFHPMDGDFIPLYIWKEILSRAWGDLASLVGVSISSPYEHTRFIHERGGGFRLFSDPANEVAEAYGVVHDLDGMAGISEPRPAVFVLDGDGLVEYAWAATEWPAFPDYDEIEHLLDRY